jgi:hypothetical protein
MAQRTLATSLNHGGEYPSSYQDAKMSNEGKPCCLEIASTPINQSMFVVVASRRTAQRWAT